MLVLVDIRAHKGGAQSAKPINLEHSRAHSWSTAKKLECILLLLCAAHVAAQQRDIAMRRIVFKVALSAEWRRVLRNRHYLQAQALHSPLVSAWTRLHERGELSFPNTTSLTRCAVSRIRCCRFRISRIPTACWCTDVPSKLYSRSEWLGREELGAL